jgi:peptide/nickel transport system substrate-binding protein
MRFTILCLLLICCAATARAERFQCGHFGGSMTYGLEANIAGLDQHTTSATSTRDAGTNIYEALVTRDDDMKPLPMLASRIEVSPDNRVYTFPLRQGVRFHNGKPMTSADVAASFNRYLRVGLDRSVLDGVAHWDMPDAMTFAITLKEPLPTFLARPGQPRPWRWRISAPVSTTW